MPKYRENSEKTSLVGLLRHGETAGGPGFRGSSDDPLTALGRSHMGSAVANREWDRVVASPLSRCADFARALSRRRSIPYALDRRIREMHFGAWEGRTAAELMRSEAEALSRFWENPSLHPPPYGESMAAFSARVLAAWKDIANAHAPGNTLFVSHGGVIRVILCHVLQHPIEHLLEFEIGRATLWPIRLGHAGARVHASLEKGIQPA